MKIAICLSGQPRTIEYSTPNILQYFSSSDYEFDFFCHSWDYNTYKRKNINSKFGDPPVYWDSSVMVDVGQLNEQILLYKPKKFLIEGAEIFKGIRFPWDSLTYSMMIANHFKKQYEIENNFRYDFVVRSRFDLIFNPIFKFTVPVQAHRNNHLDIFCTNEARMNFEYSRMNVSDEFFYGSSTAMDILTDLYRRLMHKNSYTKEDDWDWIGPGASMSDYAEDNNLRLRPFFIQASVFRPEVTNLSPLLEYDQISEYSLSFYRNTI
jgi:hypothetical protein